MKYSTSNIVLMLLMLVASGMGSVLRPTISLADERAPISLKTMVPQAFGDWREQTNASAMIVDPTQKEMLDQIYSETLTRTYVHSSGYRIMLSIAYGKNQSDALQLHKPEACYPAQGFTLLDKQPAVLDILGKPIAATRLQTNMGLRYEPITYWTVVGDHITMGSIDKKLTEMRYAFNGRIPDGMLVRISSIDNAVAKAYAMQSQFASQLIQSIAPELRSRFTGDLTLN